MLKVVTTRPVDKDIQEAVNQIPEMKIGGVFGIAVDEETGFACVVGEDVSTHDLLSLRQGCQELLMKIDGELAKRAVPSAQVVVLPDILGKLFGR